MPLCQITYTKHSVNFEGSKALSIHRNAPEGREAAPVEEAYVITSAPIARHLRGSALPLGGEKKWSAMAGSLKKYHLC